MSSDQVPVAELARVLARRIALDRPLVCLDLEATGVFVEQDRIVQIALARIEPDGGVTTWSSLVNPGQPIPPGATAIHGIDDAAVREAPAFAAVAPALSTHLAGADLAGYNIQRFDRRLLAVEWRRAGIADPTVGARVVDAYLLFVRQEPRSLEAALRFYHVDVEGDHRAHDARSDVSATLAVLAAQLDAYPDLPQTVAGIHELLYPRDPNRIDADGKLIWRGGEACIGFGTHAGTTLREMAAADRGFLEWIIRKDFADDVKRICRDALAGRFPVRPPVGDA